MKLLLTDDLGLPQAWVRVTHSDNIHVDMTVFTQDSWLGSDTSAPCDLEEFATVTCKWDGCCHWNFEDEYHHLCGTRYWVRHFAVMAAVFNVAQRTLVGRCGEWAAPLPIPEGYRESP